MENFPLIQDSFCNGSSATLSTAVSDEQPRELDALI